MVFITTENQPKTNLCQGKVSVLVGVELLEELPPLGLILVGPCEGKLGVDLVPVNGCHLRMFRF